MDENKDFEFEDKSTDTGENTENNTVEADDADNAGMSFSVDGSAFDNTAGKSFNIWKEIREWAFAIISAVVVVCLIKTFIFDCVYVSGQSMQSTLMDGDRLILTKMGYQPQKGDIIVLDSNYEKREEFIEAKKLAYGEDFSGFDEFSLRYLPWEQSVYGVAPYHFVKRVIATEGDTIDIDETTNTVYVNGTALDEPYLDEGMTTARGHEVQFPYTVEPGHIFVMGDNRENSRDSRSGSLTTVPVEAVAGKAVFRFWPLNSFGTVE